MEKVTNQSRVGDVASAAPLKLPSTVPVIEADELEGAVRKNPKAQRLQARLDERAEEGRPLGAREVDDLVRNARRSDGKPDGEQAVVIAEHARRSPSTFGGGHERLLRFLLRIPWRSLVRDLRMFVTKVREQDAIERKREATRQELEADRLEEQTRRIDLGRDSRASGEQKAVAVDEQLEADNRLRFTLERMKHR